jgi:glutathione S-transferase
MFATPARLATASVTLLAVLFYFYTAFRVGNLRATLGIKAPATSGHPTFDRAYRVQLNTLEQMGLFLPLLWLTALYPIGFAYLAPLIGLLWLAGRLVYLRGYMQDPERRLIGAMISGATNAALLIIALIGLVRAWLLSGPVSA